MPQPNGMQSLATTYVITLDHLGRVGIGDQGPVCIDSDHVDACTESKVGCESLGGKKSETMLRSARQEAAR